MITVNPDTRKGYGPAGPFRMTRTECALLRELMANAGKVISKTELLRKVWEFQYFGDTRTLEVYIHHVRRKLGESGRDQRHIQTERNRGYKYVKWPVE